MASSSYAFASAGACRHNSTRVSAARHDAPTNTACSIGSSRGLSSPRKADSLPNDQERIQSNLQLINTSQGTNLPASESQASPSPFSMSTYYCSEVDPFSPSSSNNKELKSQNQAACCNKDSILIQEKIKEIEAEKQKLIQRQKELEQTKVLDANKPVADVKCEDLLGLACEQGCEGSVNLQHSSFGLLLEQSQARGRDVSTEETMAALHESLQCLLDAGDSLVSRAASLPPTTSSESDLNGIKQEMRELRTTLKYFKTFGHQGLKEKIVKALENMKMCSQRLKLGNKKQLSSTGDVNKQVSAIMMGIVLAEFKARDKIERVKSDLVKQLSCYKSQLEGLCITEVNNPQHYLARSAALDLCTKTLHLHQQ